MLEPLFEDNNIILTPDNQESILTKKLGFKILTNLNPAPIGCEGYCYHFESLYLFVWRNTGELVFIYHGGNVTIRSVSHIQLLLKALNWQEKKHNEI